MWTLGLNYSTIDSVFVSFKPLSAPLIRLLFQPFQIREFLDSLPMPLPRPPPIAVSVNFNAKFSCAHAFFRFLWLCLCLSWCCEFDA